MNKKRIGLVAGIAVVSLGAGWMIRGLFAGDPPPRGGMQMPPAAVRVLAVQKTRLAVADEYIASVEAVQEVMIRPEVAGQIDGVHFAEGAFVKAGSLLFTIDRSAYQATANAAAAEMARAKKRYNRLKKADKRSVSASDVESAEGEALGAKAAYELAMVDLKRTEIFAPISGRIGAARVTKGNYVTPASTELARIVQIDPIRVVFSQTDRDYLAARKKEIAGNSAALEARVVLPDGSVFPNIGKKDFDDNAINPSTGTISVRYLFDNPDGLLLPGAYVNVRISNPAAETGIKIPLRSLLIDQDGTYVLTVDEAGTVATARVESGDQIGPDVIILSGLNPGDQVVIDGIQKAIPGTTVQVMK